MKPSIVKNTQKRRSADEMLIHIQTATRSQLSLTKDLHLMSATDGNMERPRVFRNTWKISQS